MDRLNQWLRRVPTAVVWVLGALPFCWLIAQAATNQLGPDPVKAIELSLGLWGLQFLIASLAITPIRILGINLLKFRRALGVYAFLYVMVHFLAWMILDMGLRLDEVLRDLTRRPYIIVGMIGLLAMLPLALTSTNAAIRYLGGARWRSLHRLAYLAGLAGSVHFILLVKGWQAEPLIYALALLCLLLLRLPRVKIGLRARGKSRAPQRV